MAITCWVPGCNHNNIRDSCKFYRFPIDKKDFNRWLTLIRRDDSRPGAGARVCSCHFIDGKKENDPTVFFHNEQTRFKKHHLSPEKRKRAQKKVFDVVSAPSTSSDALPENLPGQYFEPEGQITGPNDQVTCDEPVPSTSHDDVPSTSHDEPIASTSRAVPGMSSTMYEAELYIAQRQLEEKDKIIKTLKFRMSYDQICESNKLILEYTGLPRKDIFESLYKLIDHMNINYFLKWKVQKLSKRDQLLMTLMKLRQNFPYTDLAYRFQVSEGTVTNIIVTFIFILHRILFLNIMKDIPPREKTSSCLPNCASSFTNCRIILDCTEIFCAVPRQSMKNQRLTYSSYKHRNTFKGLIGVAPNGVVTYVSKLYPGSTSDKAIVQHCGILNQLVPGDLIIADKGFLIRDILPNGVHLNVPPFLCTPQFTPEQVQRTERIAKVRIHVERAICRMKTYKILSFMPEMLFSYSTIIFQTVGALSNLQYPLIREVAEFYDK